MIFIILTSRVPMGLIARNIDKNIFIPPSNFGGIMHKRVVFFLTLMVLLFISIPAYAQQYVILAWNDLGMHCANQDFSTFVVLPPYNNVHAQAILKGDALNMPQVVTNNLHVTYEIPGNTYSVGKTNFWDYDVQIFGVDLPPNIGLTGNGLTGNLTASGNNFVVTGIPITPFTDADLLHEDPFQLGLFKLYDSSNNLLAETQNVVPVSNEINCISSGCHSSANSLLNAHENEGGYDPNIRPILCATCHSSNALGAPGHPGVPSLSQIIHQAHGERTNDCYKCHPGPNTQCLRDIMSTQHGMVCQDCHGSVSNVGNTIEQGREPWLEEPSCGATQCHGAQYAEEPGQLFRNSRGHGGLFCSACHGEPHAIVTSRVDRDNLQNITLQGHAGTLSDCTVCHGVVPNGPGPHGILVADQPPVINPMIEPNIVKGGHGTVRVSASDANGDPITLSAELLPPNATFHDSTGGIGGVVFNPDLTQVGQFHVRIIAHSTTLADSQMLTLTVYDTTFVPRDYVLIGWNDLGMHCSNQDFSKFVVLPPFNNVHAQAIRVGDALNNPEILTTGYHVTYEIPGNTISTNKTNFWDYDLQVFGVDLPPNVGLTGNGLSGNMVQVDNNFLVTGIPITPYTDSDLQHEDPFQLGLLKLYDSSDNLLATAPPVVPVSNEINCVSFGCHASAQAILNLHAPQAGFDPNNPILCASCHGSNALGLPGNPDLPSLSQAVHEFHGSRTNDCYKCHPGPNTSCLRDIMSTRHGMTCQDCHGSVAQVGQSIAGGRQPWLQEPSCGATQCHGTQYAEEPGQLYRNSRGHGGLFCSACHGEPHAIVTSRIARDNTQNIALQSRPGTLNRCETCHGFVPDGPGPHNIIAGSCNYVTGDANNNSVFNGIDVTYSVTYFKGGSVPPYSCDCNGTVWYVAGDVNGNCSFNGIDVTYMVSYFKGGSAPIPCPSCPPAITTGKGGLVKMHSFE
jgi:hypothetical protein